MKNNIIRTLISLNNLPESIHSNDIQALEASVKRGYYIDIDNFNKRGFIDLRKVQFIQSTSNNMRKIALSFNTLHLQSLIATHTARFKWFDCLCNVVMSHSSLRRYVMKNGVYVSKCLLSPPRFVLERFLQ